jgi:hypothetical protein
MKQNNFAITQMKYTYNDLEKYFDHFPNLISMLNIVVHIMFPFLTHRNRLSVEFTNQTFLQTNPIRLII